MNYCQHIHPIHSREFPHVRDVVESESCCVAPPEVPLMAGQREGARGPACPNELHVHVRARACEIW